MNDCKLFDLGTLLTVTTDKMFTYIGNLYEILNYMTGDSVYTHQLTRVANEIKPIILEQHPFLSEIDASDVNTDNWWYFLDIQREKFGDIFEIVPCGLWDHRRIDPQEELEQMVDDPSKIIIIPNIYGGEDV